MTALYVAPRVPICDPKTGICTPIWYRLFIQVFGSVGIGGVDDSLAFEIAPNTEQQFFAAKADDVTPVEQTYFFAQDVLPVIADLQGQIAMLRADIDDLRKGTAI